MKHRNSKTKSTALLTAAISAATALQSSALEFHPLGASAPAVDMHGFASQGFLYSTDYNYLATDSTDGSFKFSEAGVNLTMNPFPRTRITAQGFVFDVGKVGAYEIALDYALIDYNFCDAFGVRGGRIIRPEGIYNSIQSIDLARTSVLLPQGLYDARYRDFSGAVDGVSLYGNVGLNKAGSLSYELYGGMMGLSQKGGLARLLQDSLNHPPYTGFEKVGDFPTVGVQLWWTTPLDGFRVGLSAQQDFGFNYDYYVSPLIGGPGDIAGFADATVIHPSLEYLWKSWTFQAEYSYIHTASHDEVAGNTIKKANGTGDAWYVGAAYRFNKWLEVGTYYTEKYDSVKDRDGSNNPGASPSKPASDAYQKDVALSFRFDPKPWWIIKVEGHYIHGTTLLHDTANNPVRNGDGWFMLAVKTTVSF